MTDHIISVAEVAAACAALGHEICDCDLDFVESHEDGYRRCFVEAARRPLGPDETLDSRWDDALEAAHDYAIRVIETACAKAARIFPCIDGVTTFYDNIPPRVVFENPDVIPWVDGPWLRVRSRRWFDDSDYDSKYIAIFLCNDVDFGYFAQAKPTSGIGVQQWDQFAAHIPDPDTDVCRDDYDTIPDALNETKELHRWGTVWMGVNVDHIVNAIRSIVEQVPEPDDESIE